MLSASSGDQVSFYTTVDGDLWWDATNKQLKAWVGTVASWSVVGPLSGVEAVANWAPESILAIDTKSYPVLTGYIGKDPVIVVSNHYFVPVLGSNTLLLMPVRTSVQLLNAPVLVCPLLSTKSTC